jgi:hypothetical protein
MTMRIWVLALWAVVIGIASGLGSTWLEFARIGSQFEPHNQAAGALDSARSLRQGPKAVVVGDLDYDFGVGQRNGTLNHTFQIRNGGDEPLRLEKGATSCKCTLSDLKTGELPPGQTADVRLDWKLITLGVQFRQTAEIHTNDLARPTLVLAVHGKVSDLVRLEPSELALTGVTANEGATETVHLYGFKVKELQIVSQEFSNPETASFFNLTWRPATAEEMQDKKEATCGLTGTLTVKPGLPLGPINQTIQLKSNVADVDKLELTVTGSVISDISIVGPSQFSEKRSVLSFGTVQRDRGARATLRILVKGPHREDVKLTLREVDPQDVLSVKLGEARKINEGVVYMYPLQIEIPTGSRLVNRLGTDQAKMGRIVIETTHPTAKTIPIQVKFAVE